jgi:hypothetical protein
LRRCQSIKTRNSTIRFIHIKGKPRKSLFVSGYL